MNSIPFIDADFINKNTDFNELINALKDSFNQSNIEVPMRHHHDFKNPKVGTDTTLLLMPAWEASKNAGVKLVTVSPKNANFNLPSIQGIYIYLNAITGEVQSILEAKSLTVKRTAAASALASLYLAKKNASSMLMIGTGALSTNLIRAHAAVRPIKKVYIWGRNFEKATQICELLSDENFECIPIKNYLEKISDVDIISCATLSKTPLVFGKYLKPGQHIDLVGAYKTDMREADDEAIKRSSIYIDTFQGGLKESGDIVIPMNNGILKEHHIKADLFKLCSNANLGRQTDTEITLFKSVGHALEDLVAANYINKKMISDE